MVSRPEGCSNQENLISMSDAANDSFSFIIDHTDTGMMTDKIREWPNNCWPAYVLVLYSPFFPTTTFLELALYQLVIFFIKKSWLDKESCWALAIQSKEN